MTCDDSLLYEARKYECEEDISYFYKYFFKHFNGQKLLLSEHHFIILSTLQKVLKGGIKRLIINIPPGYSKTMFTVKYFIAYCLCLMPFCRFLHLSYSDALALDNSRETREIIKSEPYSKMWGVKTKDDSDSVKKWWTVQGGGIYATSSRGQVTGFRAGHMVKGFSGGLLIDDPSKPEDVYRKELTDVNKRFNETISSRLAHENIPIIVIMQRIHKNDLSGYLLRGGSGEKWHHLNLPVFIKEDYIYPEYYTHGVYIDHKLPNGWLWDYKHNDDHLQQLKSSKRTFYSQYMQEPEKYNVEGALWKQEWIDDNRITNKAELPKFNRIVVAIDPAVTNNKNSDDTGIVVIGRAKIDKADHFYLFYDATLKSSPAKWAKIAVDCYHEFQADLIVGEVNNGGDLVENNIRNEDGNINYKSVRASRGKAVRAEPIAGLTENGRVHFIGNFEELEKEITEWVPDSGMKSPGRLDSFVWGVTELMGERTVRKLNYVIG